MWKKGELVVNRDYQRNEDVWSPGARTFFIETLLLGYPIPKLYLFQRTDIKTKRTVLEVVDGQQRTQSIVEFFSGSLKLNRRSVVEGARNKTFNSLPEELQGQFLEYGVPCDVFVSATSSEVREVFRRMNSHTVSLNAEEKRHAAYQGAFKWFINELAKQHGDSFKAMGVFSEKELVRMQDAKLLADVIHALTHGIQTTKPKDLDGLYEQFDEDYPAEDQVEKLIASSISFLLECKDVHGTELMRSYVFHNLILAVIHAQHPMAKLKSVYPRTKRLVIDKGIASTNLSALAGALATGEVKGRYKAFVAASEGGGTNVKDKRETRFKWLSKALEPKML
jgi:hypothetical protein